MIPSEKGQYNQCNQYSHYNSYNIPVQLFCAVSTLGEITPILFKYETAEHEILSVRIDSIHTHCETKRSGIREIVYTCSATWEGSYRMFQLKYNIELHRWFLQRSLP